MLNINTGELRNRIEVQRFEHKTDAQGFSVEEWTTILTPRCKIEFDDRLVRQVIKEHGVNATMAMLFIFRKPPRGLKITSKDRIFYDGTYYEIYGVEDLEERGRYLKIWARTIW